MGVFPSGQWGQTVNLLLFSFGGSNPPAPTKNSSVVMTLEFLFYWNFYKAPALMALCHEERGLLF